MCHPESMASLSLRPASSLGSCLHVCFGAAPNSGHCVCVQGEVEQISLMKPKAEEKGDTGLLEYLEDIIGTDKLIPQIEEEAKKYDLA